MLATYGIVVEHYRWAALSRNASQQRMWHVALPTEPAYLSKQSRVPLNYVINRAPEYDFTCNIADEANEPFYRMQVRSTERSRL